MTSLRAPLASVHCRVMVVFISLLLAALPLLASSSTSRGSFSFTSFKSGYGFVQKEVMRILQDQTGRMWFATWDGIYQFDGYGFRNYKAHPGDGVQLESNRLEDIVEDGNNLWMRGYNGSISRFDMLQHNITSLPLKGRYKAEEMVADPAGGLFIHMADNRLVRAWQTSEGTILTATFFGKNGPRINDIYVDSKGQLWILTTRGLYRWSKAQRRPVLQLALLNGQTINESCGSMLISGSEGRLVVMEHGNVRSIQLPTAAPLTSAQKVAGGFIVVGTRGDGLFVVTPQGQISQHFTASNSLLGSNIISEIRKDRRGDLWFGCNAPSVMYMEGASQGLYRFYIDGEFNADATSYRNPIHIAEDSYGHLWVSPSGNGLALFDRKNYRLIPFLDTQRQQVWTAENAVVDMFVDKQSNFWFSSKYTGLQKATYRKAQFGTLPIKANTESGYDVRGIWQDGQGRLWVGARSGVVSVFDKTMRYIGFLTRDGNISTTGQPLKCHAYCFEEQEDGTLWIGSKFGGLFRLRPRKGSGYDIAQFTADGKPFSLCHNDIFSLCIDHHNRLWIGTFGSGLCYINLRDNSPRFIHSANLLKSYPHDGFNRVRCIAVDKRGYLWVGTTSGLLRFAESFRRPEGIAFQRFTRNPYDKHSLSVNDVVDLCFAHDGRLYVSTYGGGFCRVDHPQQQHLRFLPFTVSSGLKSDVLFSGKEDRQGNLWFASENSLIKYTPKTDKIETFSNRFFGQEIDLNEGQALRLQSGHIIFPSRNHAAMLFNPTAVRVSAYRPPLIFSRFFLEQRECSPRQAPDILPADINSLKEITLPIGKNSFSIEFAALDYRDPDNISYAYKLEGLEKEWNISGNNHLAAYSSLPPGHYTFLLRSTNSDGVWVDNLRRLSIEVEPSFWQTPWAWLLYAVCLVLVIVVATYVLFTILRLQHKVRIEQELSELKIRFFTNLSHEIRTPLTLIAGSVREILQHNEVEGQTKRSLQVVDANTERLNLLVSQILDIRKIENGSMRLNLQHTALKPFVERTVLNFSDLARRQHIHLEVSCQDEALMIWVDREKLDKMLFNLLSNAFRFTPQGKQIRMTLEGYEQGARIVVADEGRGIAPNRMDKIFELFQSDDEGSVIRTGHTGVGLALTKELVELHRGSIKVESVLSQGTAFTITLPFNAPIAISSANYLMDDDTPIKLPQAQSMDNELLESDAEEASPHSPTLLVVEDNSEMQQFIRLILQHQYNVELASNGVEGMEKAQSLQPDLIVTDLMMPRMDGLEMARQLRADITTSHIPIVILTARVDNETKVESYSTGIDAYLEKPFSADVLRARIEGLLRRQRELQNSNRNRFIQHVVDKPDTQHINADERFLEKLTKLLNEQLMNAELNVDEVASMMGMSHSVYFKKLKALTGLGPNNFLKALRMQRAMELMAHSDYSITDISTLVGFNDVRYFAKCFKQHTGQTPTEYRSGKS